MAQNPYGPPEEQDQDNEYYRQALLKGMQPGQQQQPAAIPGTPGFDPVSLDDYKQRGGSTGGMWKGAATGALTGASLGSMAGNPITTGLGAVAGGLAGMVKGAIQKHALSAPTDYAYNDARTAIDKQYQTSYGRPATPQEIDSALSGQGWRPGDRFVGQAGLNSALQSIGKNGQTVAAQKAAEPIPTPDAPVPSAAAPGQQYKLEGFDAGKLADPTHNSPKYQMARALQSFDPRKGVTPDVLAALNKLGIGQFSGSGDKVSIANGDPRFDGVNSLDLVRGFNDPNSDGGWQYGVDGPAPAAAGPAGAAGGNGANNALAALQGMQGGNGNIQARIQAALAHYMGQN